MVEKLLILSEDRENHNILGGIMLYYVKNIRALESALEEAFDLNVSVGKFEIHIDGEPGIYMHTAFIDGKGKKAHIHVSNPAEWDAIPGSSASWKSRQAQDKYLEEDLPRVGRKIRETIKEMGSPVS